MKFLAQSEELDIYPQKIISEVLDEETQTIIPKRFKQNCATFKRPKGTGGVHNSGEGAFKIEKNLFDDLKAMQYYYPQEVSSQALEKLLKLQKEGCERSVAYIKNLLQ